MPQLVTCLSMVICETVIEDKRTNNKSLINTFNRLNASKFPCQTACIALVCALTGGHGKTPLEVELNYLGADIAPMAKLQGAVDFKSDPNQVIDLVLEFKGVPWEKPGKYEFVLLCDGQRVNSRCFLVQER